MIKEYKWANRDEWLKLRSQYIGGSDSAAVVGLNPYKSAYSVWAEKTGKIEPFGGNLATEVGTFLEEFVAKKFEEVTGKKVRRNNRSMVNDKYPWAIANIDREVVGEDAVLEIKTTSEMNLKKFKNGEFPSQYYAQVMHYLGVTEKKVGYLAVLIGNHDFRWFTIERDEDEINALMEAESRLYDCIKQGVPPVADGSASTSDALQNVYSCDNGRSVNLMAFESSIKQYISIGEQIKRLEESRDGIANTIKAYMKEDTFGETQGYNVSWKGQTRKTFDAKRFASDHKNVDLSAYYKESSSRAFKITEKKERVSS